MISRKRHKRLANLLYWKDHYAQLLAYRFPRSFFIGRSFRSPQRALHPRRLNVGASYAFYFMLERGANKFNQYTYSTKAPFVIYLDFESILEPSNPRIKHTTLIHQHKVFAASAVLTFSLYNFDQWTVMKVGENALAKFLETHIVWEAEIVAMVRTNRAMKRLSAR